MSRDPRSSTRPRRGIEAPDELASSEWPEARRLESRLSETIYEIVSLVQDGMQSRPGGCYVIEWSTNARAAAGNGAVWRANPDGSLPPTIRTSDGRYAGQLTLRRAGAGAALTRAVSRAATQLAIAEILVLCKELDAKLDRVFWEFHADRIGTIHSGIELIAQSQNIDGEERRPLLLSAVAALVEGRAQQVQSVRQRLPALRPVEASAVFWSRLLRRPDPLKALVEAFCGLREDVTGILLATLYIGLAHEELGNLEVAQDSLLSVLPLLDDVATQCARVRYHLPREHDAAVASIAGMRRRLMNRIGEGGGVLFLPTTIPVPNGE